VIRGIRLYAKRTGLQFRRFFHDRSGATALMMMLLAVPLVTIVGLATDAARGYMLKARLVQAVDAAALAGGATFDTSLQNDDIQRFFTANFPDGYMNATLATLQITPQQNGEAIEVVASATIQTTFMQVLQIDTLTVAARTVVQRAVRGMELVLVLDTTGSMNSGGKLQAMKDAADDLLDIMYGESDTIDDFWVGLVPFRARVRIDKNDTDWIDAAPPSNWKGCVDVRPAPDDTSDAPPDGATRYTALGKLVAGYLVPSKPGYTATNGYCPKQILPLTASKATVATKIGNLDAYGTTRIDVGAAWGWRLLSPTYRGYYDDPSLPLDYDEELMDKAVIILTDGTNCCSSYGTDIAAADAALLLTCQNMKDEDIIVYTISFGSLPTALKTMMTNCATSASHYFDSETSSDLTAAFQTIGSQLSSLRLAE